MLSDFTLVDGVIKYPDGTFVDGKPNYTSVPVKCRRAGGQDNRSVAQYGLITGSRMFLVAYTSSLPIDIPTTAILTAYGQDWSIEGSWTCTDLDDNVDGWRLTAV